MNTIYNVIRKEESGGGINILMDYLVNNYYAEIYMVPENKKYYLMDNPVIVNGISGIDYFLPLSSNVALALKKITSKTYEIQLFPVATEWMVDSLNSYLVQRAERLIIVQGMTVDDISFIEKQRCKSQ